MQFNCLTDQEFQKFRSSTSSETICKSFYRGKLYSVNSNEIIFTQDLLCFPKSPLKNLHVWNQLLFWTLSVHYNFHCLSWKLKFKYVNCEINCDHWFAYSSDFSRYLVEVVVTDNCIHLFVKYRTLYDTACALFLHQKSARHRYDWNSILNWQLMTWAHRQDRINKCHKFGGSCGLFWIGTCFCDIHFFSILLKTL